MGLPAVLAAEAVTLLLVVVMLQVDGGWEHRSHFCSLGTKVAVLEVMGGEEQKINILWEKERRR